jgi:membrane-bound serine protease (ClpP class)
MGFQISILGLEILAALAAAAALLAVGALLRLAFLGRKAKRVKAAPPMPGLRGRAETAIAPEGMAFVRGELWPARSLSNIAKGERVRVVRLDGLKIVVESDADEAR